MQQETVNIPENHGLLSSVIYRDIWDSQHVKMPCSPCSQCPVHEEVWLLFGLHIEMISSSFHVLGEIVNRRKMDSNRKSI